ncbi:MAG: TolC family protein, partial [Tepidimonas sp.]|nr:TolC family protein [Tepidimonas sp.]
MKPLHARVRWCGATLLVGACWLAGCAQSPSHPEAAELVRPVPAAWQELDESGLSIGAAQDPARWWEGWDDPALMAWVQAALQANTDLRAALAALAQARAARDAAQAATLPTVDASVRARRQANEAAAGNVWSAGLDASWELDVWGRRAAALSAGEADLRASAATLAWTRVALAAEVALAYFDWWSARERLLA